MDNKSVIELLKHINKMIQSKQYNRVIKYVDNQISILKKHEDIAEEYINGLINDLK